MSQMHQVAPFPDELAQLVAELSVADLRKWSFELKHCGRHAGAEGLTLVVSLETVDAFNPGEPYTVTHYMWVPPESYNRQTWARWLFEQVMLVDRHELGEGFTVAGKRPFAPGHGGGFSPYYTGPR